MVDYFVGTVKESQDQQIVLDLGMIGIALHVPNAQYFVKGAAVTVYSY